MQEAWEPHAQAAQGVAAQAFGRLLERAETRHGGQIARVARFIASTYDGQLFPFDLFELRAVDIDISDDMLACLDALRWAKADLHTLVPGGEERVQAVRAMWGLIPTQG
jgi:hypothetical protein